jgi:hypothetical protein
MGIGPIPKDHPMAPHLGSSIGFGLAKALSKDISKIKPERTSLYT